MPSQPGRRSSWPNRFVVGWDALLKATDLVRPGIMGTEYQSEGTTVGAVVEAVLRPYDDGTSRIIVSGPDVPVGATAVTSLALALHETATNAAKYGALSEPNGSIQVNWKALGDDLHFEWTETGGPVIDAPPKINGFGSMLTERSITHQLNGKIKHDWRRNGLTLELTVPLEIIAA